MMRSMYKQIKDFSSVQFSRSVVSNSLQPHELQHVRPPCPSPPPGVHPNSSASSQWCHPAISSSVVPFSCPKSLPASGSFPMSQLFEWGGQSIGVSASASVLPVNTQDWNYRKWFNLLCPPYVYAMVFWCRATVTMTALSTITIQRGRLVHRIFILI